MEAYKRQALENEYQQSQPFTDNDFKKKFKETGAKTTYAPIIAKTLINLPNENRRIPPKIKELFVIQDKSWTPIPSIQQANISK